MNKRVTLPRKCRRGHFFVKDKFLTYKHYNKWKIIRNCKYCSDAHNIETYLNVNREEILLRRIFGEKQTRFIKGRFVKSKT